jgi:hypothetical protein
MIAISATLQNWGKKIGKTCCQQVRSSFVSFPFSFVSLSSSLVSPSLSHSLFTPSAAAAAVPPHPLHSIYLRSNSKFTFIRRMKKSKLLMMKNETRIVPIHSTNEEEERTPDEEETRIAHIHSVNGRRDKNGSHSFGE